MSYTKSLQSAAERVGDNPRLGRDCSYVRDGLRSFGVSSHIIFYFEVDGGIEIVRILHERMDPSRHL